MKHVYLDHQSTTPLLPEVFEAMKPFFLERFGSASSLHRHGLVVRDALAKAREQIAALIHAESPEEIVFTSGGTEAVNLAVKGAAWAGQRFGNHLVVSAIEHPAVLNSVGFLLKHGFVCSWVKVDPEGRIDPQAVRAALTDRTALVAVHLANHDIGTVQPVAEIGRIAASAGVPLFVDAVAAAGWLPIDVQAMGVSLLALTAHRFYGPKGAGILYRNRRARLSSLIHGGEQESGCRAGTENIPAIVGAGAAAEIAARELERRRTHTAALQRRLWDALQARIPCVRLNGAPLGPERLPHNLNVSVEFVEGEGLMLMADLQGVAFAAGTACASRVHKASPVLAAIGLDHALARAGVLLSPGRDTTEGEIDHAVDTLARVTEKLRAMSPAWDDYQRGAIESQTGPRCSTPPAR